MSNSTLDNLVGANPLLTNLAVGVGADQNFIGEQAFATVPVTAETVTYRKASNDAVVAESETQTIRGLGAMPNEVDLSLSTGTVTLNEYMLGCNLDYREREAAGASANPIDILRAKIAVAKSKILLGKEQHIADLAFGASNYGSNTSSSVDFGATGIRETIFDTKETIRKASGYDPNTFILGVTALKELLANADVKDMIKYSQGGVTKMALLAEFFGVERILVGSAIKQTLAAAGSAGTGSYVWTADSAALIYTQRPSNGDAPSQFNPSFGFLFQMGEMVIDLEKNALVEKHAYGQRYKGAIAFASAGYLFTNVDQA